MCDRLRARWTEIVSKIMREWTASAAAFGSGLTLTLTAVLPILHSGGTYLRQSVRDDMRIAHLPMGASSETDFQVTHVSLTFVVSLMLCTGFNLLHCKIMLTSVTRSMMLQLISRP